MPTKCGVRGCNRILTPWKGIYPQYMGARGMVNVCGTCDRKIGIGNLMKLAGMSLRDSIKFMTYCSKTKDDMDPQSWEDYLEEQRLH